MLRRLPAARSRNDLPHDREAAAHHAPEEFDSATPRVYTAATISRNFFEREQPVGETRPPKRITANPGTPVAVGVSSRIG